MAPLPKRRHSTRRGGKRKASIALRLSLGLKCPHCNALKLPHRVCSACGYYDGKVAVMKKEKTKKKSSQ